MRATHQEKVSDLPYLYGVESLLDEWEWKPEVPGKKYFPRFFYV